MRGNLHCFSIISSTIRVYLTSYLLDFIMESFDANIINNIILLIAIRAIEAIKERIPRSTRTPGSYYLQELLTSSPKRIYDVLCMKRETFIELCDWLEVNTDLKARGNISVQEQVAMFLWTLNYSASNR